MKSSRELQLEAELRFQEWRNQQDNAAAFALGMALGVLGLLVGIWLGHL